jgi:thiol-disulfide isomerase/thioredoxin
MVNTAALVALVVSLGAQPRGEVIDFSMTYCQPCQQMAPLVDKLAREGHSIRNVNIDNEPEMGQRYNISRCPTFILVVDGREVQRESGMLSENDLRMMLAKIPAAAPARPAGGAPAATTAAVNPPGPFRSILGDAAPIPRPSVTEPAAPKVAQREEPNRLWPFGKKKQPAPEVRGASENLGGAAPVGATDGLFASNVRIRVQIGSKINLGSGAIIESSPGQTLILTCGHIFRDFNDSAKIEVDTAPWDKPKKWVGRMVNFDIDSDVGVIAIPTDEVLPVVAIARKAEAPTVGATMNCIGCSGGATPTREQIRVTALDKYEGPATIECEGLPVQGRSGGGLFDAQHRLVGVCINADPKAQRGIYAGLPAIHELLGNVNMAHLFAESETQLAAQDNPFSKTAEAPAAAQTVPESPSEGNAFARNSQPEAPHRESPKAAPAVNPVRTPSSGSTGGAFDVPADDAEVVVIIQKKGQSQAENRVIVIQQASPKFLQFLNGELSPNEAPQGQSFGATRTPRPALEIDAAQVAGIRPTRAGLQPTTLSETAPPRPYIRKPK